MSRGDRREDIFRDDVDRQDFLKTVCDYMHRNPVRAKLLGTEDRLLGYPWSSLGWYLAAAGHRLRWIRVDRLLGEHGIGEDTAAARAERIIAEELARLSWTDAQLEERRKSDPAKLAHAARLRRGTTLTVGRIAQRLHLGTRKSAAV